MVLTKEDSIVADSTVSSSPSHTTTTAKRPTRTYGRPRDSSMVNVEHHRSSSSSSGPADSSSIYWTGPVSAQEEIPPSSDPPHPSPIDCQRYVGEGEDENSNPGASAGYEFSWREDLREMDRDDDTDDGEISEDRAKTSTSKSKLSAAPAPLSAEQRESSDRENNSPKHASMPPAPLLGDILGGSLTIVASSSQVPSNRSPSPVQNRRRVSRRAEDEDSQSGNEHEDLEDSSPTKPFPINTPERASSPTPPTSEDDEMPTTKEKGSRGSSSRKGAAPLRFEDEQILTMKSAIAAKVNHKERRKPKAPTKKEQQEMQKERQRMKAEREVHIPQAESSKDVSFASWAQSYSMNISKTLLRVPSNPRADPKSSPISEFSSPLPKDKRTQTTHPGPSDPKRNDSSSNVSLPEQAPSDDEDELPELRSVIANAQATFKPDSDEKRRGLHAKKLALARMNQDRATAGEIIEDEDDLEIVDSAAPPFGQRDTKRLPQRHSIPTATSTTKRNRAQPQPTAKGTKKTLTPGDVNKDLIRKVVVAETSARNKKKEEWLRNGGTLLEMKQDAGAPVESITELVQKSVDKRRQVKNEAGEDDEEEDDSDEEWNPDLAAQYRGSASPDPEDAGIGEEIEGVVTGDPVDVTMIDTVDNEEQDSPLKRPRNKKTLIQSDSEEENNENVSQIPARASAVIEDEGVELPSVRRGSISSFEGGTEDEYDKENDTRRMYDRGEDKENTAVVRHSTNISPRPLLGSRQGSRLRLAEGLSSRLSMSPGNRNTVNDGEIDENTFKEPQRQPLQPLERTKSLLSSPDSFYDRLRQVEPDSVTGSSGEEPTSTLEPALNLIRPRPNGGFSQFSDEESENVFAKPLQGGLSDLFESTTQNSPPSRNMKVGVLRLPSLGLTQDVDGRPILAVDDQLKRKANEIFEKEQGWVIERAEEQYNKRPELYVNDAGFLTQTRPEGSPDIYRPLPTQVEANSRQSGQALISHKRTLSEISLTPSTSTQRTPFRDISRFGLDFDGTLVESPSNRSRRRLMRKRDSTSPSRDAVNPQSTALLDAFKPLKNRKLKERPALPQRSEFVEAEAQESDEEGVFPFGKRKAGDEEEDGENEDLDKTLETLVDDRDMDEDTVNQGAVLEKYHEHTEEDDQKLEKMNQEVIQGEWRKKRRRGIGVDDSDEEDDDDYEQRKIRRKMHGDTLIDRQNIKELGNNVATTPFFESYRKGVHDDDDNNDLAYLAEGVPDVTMGDSTVVEDEQEEPEKIVTTKELRDELRQAAQNNVDEEDSAFNPHDVSWADEADEADEELNVSVKMVPGRRVANLRGAPRQRDEHEFYAQPSSRFMENDQQRTSMQNWAKAEDRMRSRGGNGRSVASATITGHGKAKPKLASGGGSLRGGPTSKDAGTGSTRTAKSLKAAPSFLKNPAMDRSSRFGQ
ncbi:hypothetical protein L218DRAFT_1073552 [Marasmius fiardii PR-910]|nr:hypothetical protein L218DRAFT_1073552 [Marasmius fiardii PR-910]